MPISPGSEPLNTASVQAAIRAGERRLCGSGRILIRKSGTEPVVRVMAEGDDEELVNRVVDDIAGALEARHCLAECDHVALVQ